MHMLRPEPPKKLSFGEALRSFRTDRRLSHHEVSLRAGARQEAVRQWEEDQLAPTSVQLKRLTATFPKLKHYSPTTAGRAALTSVAPARCPDGLVSPHSWPDTGTPPSFTAPEPAWATFGDALRYIRIAEGLDQDELGSLLSVTGSAVSAWEHDTANPIRSHYTQLLELFPALSAAPKPHAQDIQKPDGGKGIPRDGSGASTFLASVPLGDDPTEEETAAAHPVVTTSAASSPPTIAGSPELESDERQRVTVEQAGADYAQARLRLLRTELLVVDLKRQLSDAEQQVETAKKAVQLADEILKQAVADAAVQA